MKLSAKSTIYSILVGTGLLFLFSGYVFWRIQSQNIYNLHIARELEETTDFQNYLTIINEPQRLLTYDYSYWDDMVEFVTTGDFAWAKENIEPAIGTFKVDVEWILNKEFKTIYNVSKYSNDNSEIIDLPSEVQTSLNTNWFNHFFVQTDRGIIEIHTAPIQPSSDDARITTPAGYFITGRIWDDDRLKSISEFTGYGLVVTQNQTPGVSDEFICDPSGEIDNSVMIFVIELHNLQNQSIGRIFVTGKTSILHKALELLKFELSIYVLLVFALIILITLTTIYLIYRPLQHITESLKQGNPSLAEKIQHQPHEFGALARLVIASFNHRDELNSEISKYNQAEIARIESENRYRILVENAFDAIYLLRGKRYEYVNPRFCQITGYSLEEITSPDFDYNVLLTDDAKQFMEERFQARKRGDSLSGEYNIRIINRTGNLIDLEVSTVSIGQAPDIAILGIMRDSTERKLLENQLHQAQKLDSIGKLAGGVAHDFNNMLQAVIGNIELAMLVAKSDSDISKFLIEALRSAEHSADLTRQLLAFARKQMISPVILELNDTVGDMLKMLRRLLGENIALSWSPGANLWSVKIDPSQIDQILANLCINGRDAISGNGEVDVETRNILLDSQFCTDHPGFIPGDYVMLTVRDSGCGMNKEIIERIFEPFFTTKEVGKGTGLGLATVYGIVKQNEGFIDVVSEPGKGSVFNIYLPRFLGDPIGIKSENENLIRRSEGETVLLVEDDPEILAVGESMLHWLGYKVLAAGTPLEALALAREYDAGIHLLLTDVVMPVMNGRELAEKIILIRPDIKCIFMSGHTAENIGDKGRIGAGVYFMQKPFTMILLATKIREALAGE